MLMFSVAFAVGGTHLISCVPAEGVVIGKNTYNARQLQTGLVCVSVPLFFFSSTIGTIFYIIGMNSCFTDFDTFRIVRLWLCSLPLTHSMF